MYQKVTADLNFVDREKQVERFWKEHDIFRKSLEKNKGERPIHFTTGPLRPTASPISAMC